MGTGSLEASNVVGECSADEGGDGVQWKRGCDIQKKGAVAVKTQFRRGEGAKIRDDSGLAMGEDRDVTGFGN